MRARPSFLFPLFLVGSIACGAIALGCGRPGMGNQVDYNGDPAVGPLSPVLEASRLHESMDGDLLSWESAPWASDDPTMATAWIPYQPRSLIHITHPLGREPVGVLVYLSFVQEGSSPALAAGDLARVVDATDTDVTVWNDTAGTYFVRVVIF